MKLSELLQYNDIIIQCHNFPDADAVASGFGVYRYLRLNGKNPRFIYSGPQKISKPNMLLMIEKLEIPIEYVPSTEIIPSGNEILIRMLEGDINVRSDENTYLMVGISGEVYPISKNVFYSTYTCSDELPDTNYEYPPSVLDKENNCLNILTPYIKGCISSTSSFVRAKKLTKRVKIFTEWDKNNYISGRQGDYLVIKETDLTDVYVIKNKLFDKLYTKV